MDLPAEKTLFVYCSDELFQFQTNWRIAAVWRNPSVYWNCFSMNKQVACNSKRTGRELRRTAGGDSSRWAVIETFHSLLQRTGIPISKHGDQFQPGQIERNSTPYLAFPPCYVTLIRMQSRGKRRKRLFCLRTSEIPVRTAVYMIKIQFTHSRTNSTKSNSSINES